MNEKRERKITLVKENIYEESLNETSVDSSLSRYIFV